MAYVKRPEDEKLLRLISKNSICFITGMAGIGKTELIKNAMNSFSESLLFSFERDTRELICDSIDANKDQIVFLDDVNENIVAAIELCEGFLSENHNLKFVLATRINGIDTQYPILHLQAFSIKQTKEYLEQFQIQDEALARTILEYSNGSPLLIALIVDLFQNNKEYAPLDIITQLNSTELRLRLQSYAPVKRSRYETTKIARMILFQIRYFGPISLMKLRMWNQSEDVLDFVRLLCDNGYISVSEDKAFATLKTMRFSDKEIKDNIDFLTKAFCSGLKKGFCDIEDMRRLVELLIECDFNCKFVSDLGMRTESWTFSHKPYPNDIKV